MPILTQYWFQNFDFLGTTRFFSWEAGVGSWISWHDTTVGVSVAPIPIQCNPWERAGSTLVRIRGDSEFVIDLPPQFNDPSTLDLLDGMLGNQAQRTSQIDVGWLPWKYVEYKGSVPSRHDDLDLLVHTYFKFHVDTPDYCSDADGYVSYYVWPSLDGEGRLRTFVDGWSYSFDGGSFCGNAIKNALNDVVPKGMNSLQSMLNTRLAPFNERRFNDLYLLPGDGDKTTQLFGGPVDTYNHVSLALVPR